MYKITLINGNIETVIHYPNPDAPKVVSPHLNKSRGQAQQLNFSIYPNNPGFNLLVRMATRVVVIDVRDNREVFSGRVYTAKKSMDEKGYWKDVVCEGELNYLHDTVQDSEIYEDKTAQEMLKIFLDYHNSLVEDYKKIQLGNVTVTDWIFCTTNNETTLEAITKYVYNEKLGYLQLRKENGVKYLDYIATTQDKVVDVSLGQNLLSLIQTDDQNFGTRIVPIGANGLTIDNVNNGKKYIEDTAAVSKYGIIYKTVEFKDIDDDTELKKQCEAQLSNYTSPKQSLELDVTDLAALANVSTNMIDENTSAHVMNSVMGIDEVWKVVEYDVDLMEVYKPKVTLSNKALSLTNSLNSIIGDMVKNDGDYNGVQFGDSFGIRVKKDDVVLTLNAKDCITLINKAKQVFGLNKDGNIVCNDIISNDMKANRGVFTDITAEGGEFNNITANNITAEKGTITGAIIQTSKENSGTERLVLTGNKFSSYNSSGKLSFTIDGSKISIYDNGNYVGSIYGARNYLQIDLPSDRQFVLTENSNNKFLYYKGKFDFFGEVYIGGAKVATVDDIPSPPAPTT